MGSSQPLPEEEQRARELGARIAEQEWVTLTGGQPMGVMHAASQGAKEAGGLVVGILPKTRNEPYSEYIDIPIFTNASHARNYYNVLSSDVVVIASRLSSGTLTEAVLAIMAQTPLVVLNDSPEDQQMLIERGGESVTVVHTPEEAIRACRNFLV